MRRSLARTGGRGTVRLMRDLLILAIHLLVSCVKLLRPGGMRAVAAESSTRKSPKKRGISRDRSPMGRAAKFVGTAALIGES